MSGASCAPRSSTAWQCFHFTSDVRQPLLLMLVAGLMIGIGLLYLTRWEDRRHRLYPGE